MPRPEGNKGKPAKESGKSTEASHIVQLQKQVRELFETVAKQSELLVAQTEIIKSYEARFLPLEEYVGNQDKIARERAAMQSINRVETFNGEEAPTPRDENGMRMSLDDKLLSIMNAIKILPPNHIVNGRQPKHNVEAICGFKIVDEVYDEAYRLLGQSA